MGRNPKTTHKIMSSVKSKNTRPEITLRRALWHQGLRFRVNYKDLPGKPDLVFTKAKLVVFCDGDYWHGHNWAIRGMKNLDEELANYSEFWINKIKGNIERDNRVNKQLARLGWRVLRIWESDINNDVAKCATKVYIMYQKCIISISNTTN